MIRAGACEKIRYQGARLGNPLPVSGLGLECRGFCGALPCQSREAIGVGILVRLVRFARVKGVAASGAVRFDRAGGGVWVYAIALVDFHATELVVESCRAIWKASTLGLAWVWSLRPRVERVCARPGARAGDLCERRARLVVGNVGLARVGEQRQNGSDTLCRGGSAGRDGDEKSMRRSGISRKSAMRRGVLHQMVVDCVGRRD